MIDTSAQRFDFFVQGSDMCSLQLHNGSVGTIHHRCVHIGLPLERTVCQDFYGSFHHLVTPCRINERSAQPAGQHTLQSIAFARKSIGPDETNVFLPPPAQSCRICPVSHAVVVCIKHIKLRIVIQQTIHFHFRPVAQPASVGHGQQTNLRISADGFHKTGMAVDGRRGAGQSGNLYDRTFP